MNYRVSDVKAGAVYTPTSISPKQQHGYEKPDFHSAGSESKSKKKILL